MREDKNERKYSEGRGRMIERLRFPRAYCSEKDRKDA